MLVTAGWGPETQPLWTLLSVMWARLREQVAFGVGKEINTEVCKLDCRQYKPPPSALLSLLEAPREVLSPSSLTDLPSLDLALSCFFLRV